MALSQKTDRTLRKINVIDLARKVIDIEIKALGSLKNGIDLSFKKAIDLILHSNGKIILTGVGKSGIVAQKISSTLTSTRTPSIFIHPTEALHGDMGNVNEGDVVIALSNSGESIEVNKFVSICKKRNAKVISVLNAKSSKLASISDVSIILHTPREADESNLIPTSSAISMMAVGDAISICLMKLKGYSSNDFVRNHPSGNIGRLLYLKVYEIMRKGKENPVIKLNATIKDALRVMTETSLGAVSVIDSKNRLCGYFTDGDIRRKFSRIKIDDKISKHMTKKPLSIRYDRMAIEAAEILESRKIDNLPVVDEKNRVCGIIDERDLIREGII